MQIEISFHNLYHVLKEKSKNTEEELLLDSSILPPDQDYDDHLHYPDLIKSPEFQGDLSLVDTLHPKNEVTQLHHSNHNNLCIEDIKNEIQSIETNNPRCITISTKIKKGLFKKVKIYMISCNKGNGYIKIKYKNGKPTEIKPFFGNGGYDRVKIGSLSGDIHDYWLGHDPFISNKYIDCLYTYSTTKDLLENHINLCYKMGSDCKFVYNKFLIGNLENPEYISQYISDFTEYTKCISNKKYTGMIYTIIYEPSLISELYNSGNRNPNNIYIASNQGKINLIQFINKMESICTSKGIHFVNVFNPCILSTLISKATETVDFNKYINIMKIKAQHIAEYYSYFKNQSTRYLAFKFNEFRGDSLFAVESQSNCRSNDEFLAYLFILKCILKNLELEGILFDIPVGHVNSLKDTISRYTNKQYESHTDKPGDYQNTATLFFFGGCATFNDIKFHQNKFKDTGLTINGDTVCWSEHISLCNTFNIKCIMFGPSTPEDTTNVPLNSRGNKCTDHNYTITKITDYYNQL